MLNSFDDVKFQRRNLALPLISLLCFSSEDHFGFLNFKLVDLGLQIMCVFVSIRSCGVLASI